MMTNIATQRSTLCYTMHDLAGLKYNTLIYQKNGIMIPVCLPGGHMIVHHTGGHGRTIGAFWAAL